jgi:NADH-quinone oxidoreductase subunit H
MSFALFFLAEYMNMILISTLTVVMFFGGWQPPVASSLFDWVPPFFWLLAKVFVVVSMFLWIRATFPRYRYDQIMRLGWKVFIPLTLVWIAVIGLWMQTPWSLWK